MLAVIAEGDRLRALGNGRHHVESGPGGGAAIAGRHVAVGVIDIGRVDRACPRWRDGSDRMRQGRVGNRYSVSGIR